MLDFQVASDVSQNKVSAEALKTETISARVLSPAEGDCSQTPPLARPRLEVKGRALDFLPEGFPCRGGRL
jgi:hypothetical protein